MDNELVSIIVPIYNVSSFLEKCVESILNQSYYNIEIILVDDGSTDGSEYMCDRYALNHSNVRVFHRPTLGPSAARNFGIDKSSGKYILFVDSDDWISKNLIEKSLKKMKSDNADITMFDFTPVRKASVDFGFIKRSFPEHAIDGYKVLELLFSGAIRPYVWTSLYKKNIFTNIRFPENRNYEDLAIAYKLFAAANKVNFIHEKLYFYLQRDKSITHTMNPADYYSLLNFDSEIDEFLSENFPDLKEKAISFRIQRLLTALRITILLDDSEKYKNIKLHLSKVFKLRNIRYITRKQFIKIILVKLGIWRLVMRKKYKELIVQ
ncbi:glycosyltransferase family 2 protein [Lactiplantibacillus plantarum]|uniref:glycosyltransferase family 2 protein n=1 Tax=Lactiplantibacillus plantarum TaxID=1590 RepID=UPI002B1EA45B|nr:glycosyltransferase family 2 protein [Lactiplantibacillus plantarum]MEA5158943.1 glycosyltransferase family 2 protein [Lactiplantibacillus plantarum]